jgi:hypothetical protein
MGAHAGKDSRCFIGPADCEQPSFTRQVQRIEPKELARRSHGGMNRNCCFPQPDSDLCAGCNFMQCSRNAASGWIAQDMQIGMNRQHRSDQGMKRCRVTFQIAVKRDSFATRQDGGAVISDGSTDDDYVAGTGSLWRNVNAFGNDSQTGGGKEYAVSFAALNDFGVTADDGNGGALAGLSNCTSNAIQIGQRKAFFKDEANGECKWLRTGHGDIIDASVYCEITDAATGKEQGRDNKGVGGYRDATGRRRQDSRIMTDCQLWTADVTRK